MNNKGFTLIELIIVILISAILLIPLSIITMEFIQAIIYSRDSGVAEALVKTEMAKVNNLSYASISNSTQLNYEGYPYDLYRTVTNGPVTNTKQVDIKVYPAGNATNYLLHLVSFVANVSFGAGSQGGPIASGDSQYLVVSGGNKSGKNLQNVTLQNTKNSAITITGVIISFTGSGGIKLNRITMNGIQRWNGNSGSPATVTLTSSFTLAANTTYTNTGLFVFSKTLSSVTSLVFVMSDGSQTSSYAW